MMSLVAVCQHYMLFAGKNITFFDPKTNETHSAPEMENPTWFMAGCVVVATILILFFKTNYKRLEVCVCA